MRAAVYDAYGKSDVVEVREVPAPWPRRGEVLVRVRAAALNPKDVLVRMGKLWWWAGPRFPKQIGYDWAGEAVALGPAVRDVRIGDPLFGMIQRIAGGACAELVTVKPSECSTMPTRLRFEEAAAVPLAAQTALQALRDHARVRPGDRVLVNGASGGVGTFAIRIAKLLGAHVVTTSSAGNIALCRDLGADVALDYATQDPLDGRYDVIFDVFGNRPFDVARRALTPHGTWVSTVLRAHVFVAGARTLLGAQRARLVVVRSRREDLAYLAKVIDEGRLTPVIDEVFPLDAIAAAMDRVGSKHARGKVIVKIP